MGRRRRRARGARLRLGVAAHLTRERHLEWDGCCNVRDLGGLRTADGRETRWGAIVRGDAPERLSASGWSALSAYGIRTIIDLRNDGERPADLAPRPDGLTTLRLPLDGIEDTEFWDHWGQSAAMGTPLYYGPFLERFPQRVAAVFAAIAAAPPGGILIHCRIGRDRTGLITMLLLALAGVPPEDIAADHALSTDRVRTLFPLLGLVDQGPIIEAFLQEEGVSAAGAIAATLAALDVAAYLQAAGLGEPELRAARARLVDS